MKNILIFVEGNHDTAYLSKVLNLLGFDNIKNYSELNKVMINYIPRKFPFEIDSLNIFNNVPCFFKRDNVQIAIINANGETNILTKIDDVLSAKLEILEKINHIIIFADGDLLNKEQKISNILTVKYNDFEFIKEQNILKSNPFIDINEGEIPISFYIFPNNESSGRLEDIILSGIKITDLELHDLAVNMLDKVNLSYKEKWNQNSKYEKALIGIVGNVLLPSYSSSVSISSKKTNWISHETKEKVKEIDSVYNFLNEIIFN